VRKSLAPRTRRKRRRRAWQEAPAKRERGNAASRRSVDARNKISRVRSAGKEKRGTFKRACAPTTTEEGDSEGSGSGERHLRYRTIREKKSYRRFVRKRRFTKRDGKGRNRSEKSGASSMIKELRRKVNCRDHPARRDEKKPQRSQKKGKIEPEKGKKEDGTQGR